MPMKYLTFLVLFLTQLTMIKLALRFGLMSRKMIVEQRQEEGCDRPEFLFLFLDIFPPNKIHMQEWHISFSSIQ